MKDVAACEVELTFEVDRRKYFAMQDGSFDIRRILRQEINTAVCVRVSFGFPTQALRKLIGPVLGKDIHDVLSFGSNSGIEHTRNCAFQNGGAAGMTPYGVGIRIFNEPQ